MELKSCPHLQLLERELREAGITTQYEGRVLWQDRHAANGWWLYFNCLLDRASLQRRLHLGEPLRYLEGDRLAGGHEAGWFCFECGSSITGVYRKYSHGFPVFK